MSGETGCAATPRAELERQIMSPLEPKNEREWWACGEIERLRSALRGMVRVTNPLCDKSDDFDKVRAESCRVLGIQ